MQPEVYKKSLKETQKEVLAAYNIDSFYEEQASDMKRIANVHWS